MEATFLSTRRQIALKRIASKPLQEEHLQAGRRATPQYEPILQTRTECLRAMHSLYSCRPRAFQFWIDLLHQQKSHHRELEQKRYKHTRRRHEKCESATTVKV